MIYAIALILLALSAPDQGAPAPLVCDAALVQLFTPEHPRLGRYEVCTVEGTFDAGAFHLAEPERLEALDAFGSGGSYDRARLARLYGGRRITVVRGWRQAGDRFESITLLSPYPDASLSRLNDGTLIIRWITASGP